jgi:arylsulfatase A-like enzyme
MNVVLISIDSLRADALNTSQVPNLSAMARNGCTFDTTIVQAPFTIPSHASMLTGLYPFNHGLQKQYGQKLSHYAQTIFHYLEERGYFTSALLGIDIFGSEQGYQVGFQEDFGHSTLSNIHRALSQARNRPFLLFLHYWDVHTPYRVMTPIREWSDCLCNLAILLDDYLGYSPRGWIPHYGPHWLHRIDLVRKMLSEGKIEAIKTGYNRAVRQMDRWVGGILQMLKNMNLDQNTIVIFTSDHGESFNEHGEAYEYPSGYEHAVSLYETLVKVPMLIYGPGVPAGKHICAQIETIDIVPTIYELLGFEPSADEGFLHLDGQSLCRVWETRQGKELTYSETHYQDCNQVMIRSRKYKLIRDRAKNEDSLFDLQTDTEETQNLIEERTEIYEQMVSALEAFEATHQQAYSTNTEMDAIELSEVTTRLKDLGYVE